MPVKPGKTGCDNFCGGILANLPAGSLQLWQQPLDFQKEGVVPFHSSFFCLLDLLIKRAVVVFFRTQNVGVAHL